jgi:hypothetical protein
MGLIGFAGLVLRDWFYGIGFTGLALLDWLYWIGFIGLALLERHGLTLCFTMPKVIFQINQNR